MVSPPAMRNKLQERVKPLVCKSPHTRSELRTHGKGVLAPITQGLPQGFGMTRVWYDLAK